MKLQIDKFLALTAMMATAQLGAFACTAADDADDTDENVSADDDAGSNAGESDDDAEGDDDAADDDSEGDDDVAAEGDAGADDDVAAEGDAGAEDGADDDVAAEGDAGVALDAGAEGEAWADAGGEGELLGDAGGEALPPEGDAGGEGSLECLGGGFDPALEATDCFLFDSCIEVLEYSGVGANTCYDMSLNRRESVYGSFAACLADAALADPCTADADQVVLDCAAAADALACADVDDGCAVMAESCSEIDPGACDTALAPFATGKRYEVAACFDYYYTLYAETYGPDYEGCSLEFESCLVGGPSGE